MHVRVSRLRTPPDRLDEAIRTFEQEVAPAAAKVDGNLGAILHVNRETGEGIGVTLWESKEKLDASESIGTQLRTQSAQKTGGTIEGVERYEMVVQVRPLPPAAGGCTRSVQFENVSGKIDELVKLVQNKVVPTLQGAAGLRALVCGVDRENGRIFVNTVWTTREQREASESLVAEVRQEAARIAGRAPRIEYYDVAYADVRVPATTS